MTWAAEQAQAPDGVRGDAQRSADQDVRMRVMRARLITAAISGLASLAFPCSATCFGGKVEPKDSFRRATAVLIATVEDVELGKHATLRVDELYKGRLPSTVTVDGGYGVDCRMFLEAGKQYLLFLYRDKKKMLLVPEHLCEHSGEVGAETAAV
jgi:hypothetical protein